MTLNGLDTEIQNYDASDLLFQTVGKRKCAIANLTGYRGQGNIFINHIPVDQYVQYNTEFLNKILEPLRLLEIGNEYDLVVKTNGGGIKGQTDATQLAIAKAFAALSPENRSQSVRIKGNVIGCEPVTLLLGHGEFEYGLTIHNRQNSVYVAV